jgi:hypothetical protein
MGWRIVPISLPQSAILGVLKIKKKIIIFNSKKYNLWNKMIERTYHEVLSMVVHKLLHPLLVVLTPHVSLQTTPLGSPHVQET